ncbi:tail fiber protein, partial [Flectobacillus roseus]|uniref:tail fiber protein n=1 Tax=Flectobacillus roseus TaxID=502259 RepID=UPI0024B7B52B
QAMVIGALSVGSISPNLIAQDPNNRFITDAQASYWNGKVDRSELSAYLPLTGGNMAYGAKISFDPNSYIGYGNGDNATTSAYNLEIASWWGIGFKSTVDNTTRIVFDTRAGRILSKAVRVSDFADGTNAVPVISDANGNLVKSAFSADWINTNGNRRFVTDVQVGQWNNKVERTELGAYLPLSGGYLTGKVEIQAVGGTHWSDSKLVVVTTDNTKHPSITLHSPGSSAVTIYQRNFDLYIRTDYSDAGALVHKRIWSENNHGVGSGLNADLLDGFHASYFTDVNNLITTTGKRLVSDTQVTYWNGKVDRSELGAYLPLAGGTMTGRVMFDTNCYVGYGTGDGATPTTYNLEIASWYGIGFKDTNGNKTKIIFDTRAGRILASSVRISDFSDGNNAVPVISDSNGNLVKSAFSADWINTNGNRRFVTDIQVGLWNNKVERSELGAYLPLAGGIISGRLDILAQGGTRLEEAKLCISTTNTNKPPAIAFQTSGVSAIQLYEKLGHLYIRNDNSTAYDNVHYKVWTQMNHGVDSGLNADLLDGYHASYFTDANNLITNSSKRLVSDAQMTYWNGKVDRTELAAFLPLAGGTMTGAIRFNGVGVNTIGNGTGDGATTSTYNLEIASWFGIGFKSSVDNTTKIVFDTRAGRIVASSIRISDFSDGNNAVPVISDSNGNLVKSAFSADWINTNGNRRFVTDVQVGQWNNKVERSELGAYLPLSGGYLTGKVEIQAVGGTHWSDSKLVVVTTDNTKHPSITLHSPGSSAVTIYQRNFDLYIRTDYSDAGALVHKRIWSENNHGVGSGLNADLLDGFHASYFTDVNNLITTTGKRLVSDTQVSYWNGKVDRSELGAYLPLAGGNMASGAKISFDPNSYIGYGNGDNATTTAYNLEIASWFGIGFKSTVDNTTRIVFDTRAGRILSKTVRISDFSDGQNAIPVVSDGSGNLVKSAFSADWINTNGNRRFVTDIQVGQWNNKVERSELGAYLPLVGGIISGRLDILAQGGTRLEEAKLCISTTNTNKPPAIAFQTSGVSAIQLYEKLGHLYIRNDNSTAYDNVHYKVWTQMNHGVDSGLNADLLDGYHASYFTDANNLVTNSNRRFATDTQISYWNGKVDRTELGSFLPLAGGTMTGAIRFNAAGSNNGMSAGTGDGATTTAYNLEIASWYGIGFKSTLDNTTKIVFDTRAGKIQASKVLLSDFADGQVDRLVVSQGDGSLVRSDKVRFGYNNHISTGTGDNATESTYNFEIASWWGIGFKCNVDNTTRIVFDTRAGRILSKAVRISDFADGQNAVPVVSDGSGNLVKSAFSADWINTSATKRFVSDTQINYWNGKVDRTELGAYLPLSGGYLTGKVEIQAVGGTHWSDSKLAVITTDNTKHPSITLHSP